METLREYWFWILLPPVLVALGVAVAVALTPDDAAHFVYPI